MVFCSLTVRVVFFEVPERVTFVAWRDDKKIEIPEIPADPTRNASLWYPFDPNISPSLRKLCAIKR